MPLCSGRAGRPPASPQTSPSSRPPPGIGGPGAGQGRGRAPFIPRRCAQPGAERTAPARAEHRASPTRRARYRWGRRPQPRAPGGQSPTVHPPVRSRAPGSSPRPPCPGQAPQPPASQKPAHFGLRSGDPPGRTQLRVGAGIPGEAPRRLGACRQGREGQQEVSNTRGWGRRTPCRGSGGARGASRGRTRGD